MATLYEIHADLCALAELLAEVGGEVSEADAEAAVDAWLSETQEATAEKLDRYAALIRELEARGAARKGEAGRMAALADADAAAVKRLKDRLCWFLQAHGLERVETARFRLTLASNGGKAPLLLHTAPEHLPEPWRETVTSYRARTDEIRAALEAGTPLEFATLGERGRHLRIR
jgi:hypothetical protein